MSVFREAQQMANIAKSLQMDANGALMSGQSLGGTLSNQTFERLQKALVASPSTPGGPGDGSSLIPQSLARTLKNVSFKMNNIKLWKNTAKQTAYAMTEEFDQLLSYGTRGGVFTSAMNTPAGNDSTFGRVQVPMKYMATAYATDIAIMATEVIGGSAEALQINNATRYLLRGVERNMFYGDSSLLPQAFDGVKKIITDFANNYGFSNIVIDAKAGPLTPDLLENAAQAIQDNAGEISAGRHKVYMPPAVQSYWNKTYASAQRSMIDQQAYMREGALNVGVPVGGYNSTYGHLPFVNDIFLNLELPVTTTIQNAPAIPSNVTATLNTSGPSTTGSMWQDANSASQYGVGYRGGPVQYKVEAVNSYGPSETSEATTTVTVGAGESVTVTWNRVTGTNGANYYQIYRSMNGGPFLPVTQVADAGSGVTQSWTDLNETVAGAYDVFIINHDVE
ncbi:MAG: hypothetical protein K6T83_03575, partial [Alicyclobacillus sp.]|nr:hypothetical protein [Alicyclobacillus sp.]